MTNKNIDNKKEKTITLKVQTQELDLTSLKELLEKSKPQKRKKDIKGYIVGFIITILGTLSLILSVIVNELGHYEYFSNSSLIFNIGVSLFALIFGIFILLRETR